jgi:uncharacterized protein (TIGR02147 family)
MRSVMTYIDFREYIRDYYTEHKKSSKLSFREFSKQAGFTSPSFIKLVIEGKANLSKSGVARLCNAMGLKKDDRHYFKNLALFGQAKDLGTKMHYLETLKSFQGPLTVNKLSNEQFEYFSQWYHPVIKELLDIIEFDGNFDALAKMVIPAISVEEARESLKVLLRLQLIKEESGRYFATKKFLTTDGQTTESLAVHCVQKKMAQLASDAIDTFPKAQRDISGVSVAIGAQSVSAIQEEIARCRRRILEIASNESESDSVYRINFHLFPLSKKAASTILKLRK